MSRKNPDFARSDAKLLRLPIEVKREIVKRCSQPGVSQADVLGWLHEDHSVDCSSACLSNSLSQLARDLRKAEREEAINDWMADTKARHPELSDAEIFAMGQRKFSLITIAEEDIDGWATIQGGYAEAEKLKLKKLDAERADQKLKLEREKFEQETAEKLLDQALREKADEINNSNLSNADKIAAMRREAFKSVDALQQSGKVKIPKA